MLPEQRLELAARDGACAEAREVARGQLAVDHRERVAPAHRHQVRQRDLRGIACAAEHRLAEEHPAEAYPVETAGELTLLPYLDAVGVAQLEEPQVRGAHLRSDPGDGNH